ncbi:hypothetical protein D477_014266 [Arthrobacter crystallopoietes BAB-32]|uniref:Uncharacterized protein n=1 Tax=Arthrobacter crystallopoietes BAB-32 TaxID=1246476 RepID=N1V5N2_9MICC|nr:hypothetical protein [Arthrobacter crystallopoietes]EMY33573.1 hypothetical protein D477_014266 [Arthrobacter crystallopoietes BAB-32]
MTSLTAYAALDSVSPLADLRARGADVRFVLKPEEVSPAEGQAVLRIGFDLPVDAGYQVFDLSRGYPTLGCGGFETAVRAAWMATNGGRTSNVQVVNLHKGRMRRPEWLFKYAVTAVRQVDKAPVDAAEPDRCERMAAVIKIHQETWFSEHSPRRDGYVTFECECGHTEPIRVEDDELTRARHCADKLIEAGF